MNRREWLKKAALIAASGIAADQLEILEHLSWTRTLFPSAAITNYSFKTYALGFEVTREMLEDDWYGGIEQHIRSLGWPAVKRVEDFERDVTLFLPVGIKDEPKRLIRSV